MIYGMDYLALGSPLWPIKITARVHRNNWAVGCFHDVFGPKTIEHLKVLLDTGKLPAVRVHLEYNKQHKNIAMKKLLTVLPLYTRLAESYRNVDFFISPTCEHAAYKVPEKRLSAINSPLFAVDCPINYVADTDRINESHSWHVPNQAIYSTDGTDILAMDAKAYARICHDNGALLCFLWAARFNLKTTAQDNTPIAKRKCIPDKEYLEAIFRSVKK